MVNTTNTFLDLFAKRCPSCHKRISVLSLLLFTGTTTCKNCGVRISSNSRAITLTLVPLYLLIGLPAKSRCGDDLSCLLVVTAIGLVIGLLVIAPIYLLLLRLKVEEKNHGKAQSERKKRQAEEGGNAVKRKP